MRNGGSQTNGKAIYIHNNTSDFNPPGIERTILHSFTCTLLDLDFSNLQGKRKLVLQNKLKDNFSGSVYLLQVANVTGISTKWFANQIFQGFELHVWRVLIFPKESRIYWFEFAGVSSNSGFEKSGVKFIQR